MFEWVDELLAGIQGILDFISFIVSQFGQLLELTLNVGEVVQNVILFLPAIPLFLFVSWVAIWLIYAIKGT